MTRTLFLLLFFSFTHLASADPRGTQFFYGVSGQYVVVHEIISSPPGVDPLARGRTFSGPGVQLEGGLAGERVHVYGGFRYDYATRFTEGDKRSGLKWEEWNTREEWFSQHALVGARLKLPPLSHRPVSVVLGGGVSLGWAQMAVRNWKRVGQQSAKERCDEHRIRNYNARFGWLAESGIVITALHPLDYWVLLRLDSLGMGQPRPSPYSDTIRNHMQAALSLGCSYTFGH